MSKYKEEFHILADLRPASVDLNGRPYKIKNTEKYRYRASKKNGLAFFKL